MDLESEWIDQMYDAACSEDSEEAFRRIDESIEHGVDPNININEGSNTPLYWAVFGKRIDIARHLIKRGATPNAELNCDDTSLHSAAQDGSVEIMKLLLTAPHDLVLNSYDKYIGHTPLIWAVEKNHIAAVATLIDAGAEVNACSEQMIDDPAIKGAVENGNIEMVQLLLDHGANPTQRGWMQLTAVHTAQERQDELGNQMIILMKDTMNLPDAEWAKCLLTKEQLKPRYPSGF